MSLEEQYTQHENRFKIHDAVLDFEDLNVEDPEINKIECEQVDSDAEVHIYPKHEVTKEQKVNGMKGKSTENVNYKSSNVPKWVSSLIKTASNLDEDKVIVIEATSQVNEYSDGNKVFRIYQNMIESDSFKITVEEHEDEGVEDESDDEDEESSESESDEDVLFGGNDEE